MLNFFHQWLHVQCVTTPRRHAARKQWARRAIAQIELLEGRKLLTLINGTAGDDRLDGQDTDDTINGYGGNDAIRGFGGNDTIDGGAGIDDINGNSGNDWIHAGDGNDVSVRGGSGDDNVWGDAGNDHLYGDLGDDQLMGGAGSDIIEGNDGNDTLFDDDPRTAGISFGDDQLFGGNGNDNIISRGGSDTADGGAGADVFQYDAPADITTNPTFLGTLTIQNFIIGEDRIDLFQWARRGFGPTRLLDNFESLMAATEQLSIGACIHLGVGTVTGSGAYLSSTNSDVAHIILAGVNMSAFVPTMFDMGTGNNANDPEHYGPQVDRRGDDLISDPTSADTGKSQTIYGGSGDDIIRGMNGDDWIGGNGGTDFLYGDSGNDHILAGKDTDFVHGGDGNDILSGENNNDYLWGDDGNDELYGDRPGTANKTTDPRVDGNDELHGGRGSNRLEGGLGNDTFVIDPDVTTTDTIVDFGRFIGTISTTNNDIIDLNAFPEIRTFEQLVSHARQIGNDVILDLTTKSVVIQNFLKGAMVPQMFLGNASISDSPPTNLILSSAATAENQPAGTVVGLFTTEDPNNDGPFTVSLVGGTDNDKFTIDASSRLVTAASFDFEVKNAYSIRVRSTDSGGLWYEKSFTINVTNVDDVPLLYEIESTTLSAIGPLTTPVTASLRVYDQDSDYWTGATVTVTANYLSNQDQLGFTNTSKISSVWNATTGTLTLTGTDTVSNYRSALRNVTYHNTSGTPNVVLKRTIGLKATDGSNFSNVMSRDLTVRANSGSPTVAGFTAPLTFIKGTSPVALVPNLVVTHPDGLSLSSATVTFANWQSGDRLEFSNVYAFQHTFTEDLTTHVAVLTITGNGSVDQYQATLRSTIFWNVAGNPVTSVRRIATFAVKDLLQNVGSGNQEIGVSNGNANPLVTVNDSTPLTYKANDPAMAIFGNALVADADSNLLTSLTVQITSGYQNDTNGKDVLSFTNQYGITGVFDSTTGKLTFSGSVYVGYYREVLRLVKFSTTGSSISTANRTFTVIATDDFLPVHGTSLPVTRSLKVT